MPDEALEALENISDSIAGWQTNLFEHGVWYTVIVAAIAALITFILLRVLKEVYSRRKHGNLRFFYNLINIVVISVAVLIVMMTITPLARLSRTILAGSGLLAVVIGIAAQASLGNVFSGISIGISRPFVIGETIEIIGQDIIGVVTEIGLRQTVIRDFNNKHIVIPNSVIDKEIIRTVQHGNRAVINYLMLNIGYGSDVDAAIEIIRGVVLAHKDFYDTRGEAQIRDGVERNVDIAVIDLTDSAIRLRASVWSKDAGTGFAMLSDLRRQILRAFADAGIEIPYPYRNVIVKGE